MPSPSLPPTGVLTRQYSLLFNWCPPFKEGENWETQGDQFQTHWSIEGSGLWVANNYNPSQSHLCATVQLESVSKIENIMSTIIPSPSPCVNSSRRSEAPNEEPGRDSILTVICQKWRCPPKPIPSLVPTDPTYHQIKPKQVYHYHLSRIPSLSIDLIQNLKQSECLTLPFPIISTPFPSEIPRKCRMIS